MTASLPLHPDAALGLALALIASSTAPLVLLDGDLTVVAVSRSFCQAFGIDLASAPGHSIFELGAGEWDVRQLRVLLESTVDGDAGIDAYEMDLERAGRETRRLVIGAHKLDYADVDGIRVVLSVSDVTDARLSEKHNDDLLREKTILLQELQHRVANSLQIIASVLLQSASRIPSDEVRSHLYDAHNRVMSVAAVQQQLAATRLGEVGVRAYFIDLCRSIGASMIPDPQQLSLDVEVDTERRQFEHLREPWSHRDRTCDQRSEARLPRPPPGKDNRRLPFGRPRVEAVGERQWGRDACGSRERQGRPWDGNHRGVGRAAQRPGPGRRSKSGNDGVDHPLGRSDAGRRFRACRVRAQPQQRQWGHRRNESTDGAPTHPLLLAIPSRSSCRQSVPRSLPPWPWWRAPPDLGARAARRGCRASSACARC